MTILLVTVILGLSLIAAACLSASILAKSFKEVYEKLHSKNAALECLYELVDNLNEHFPGSNITVEETESNVKVKGELKYLKDERI